MIASDRELLMWFKFFFFTMALPFTNGLRRAALICMPKLNTLHRILALQDAAGHFSSEWLACYHSVSRLFLAQSLRICSPQRLYFKLQGMRSVCLQKHCPQIAFGLVSGRIHDWDAVEVRLGHCGTVTVPFQMRHCFLWCI